MLLLTVLLVVGVTATKLPDKPYYDLNDARKLFNDFIQKYNRVYIPEEYSKRLEIFKDKLKEINERNARHPNTVFSITHFADLMEEERSRYLGFLPIDDEVRGMMIELRYSAEKITAPEEFDWRDHGVVSPVKSQGDCGSCFIFSAIGNIEGQYALKHKLLLEFSEQECLDCSPPFGGGTNCQGGWPHKVWFNLASLDYGYMLQEDYPYTAKVKNCSVDASKFVTNVTGFQLWMPDEESLKQLLYETGPLSVGIDSRDVDSYTSGILKPHKCKDHIDHAALLVGYGIENGEKYWIVKNSYGEKWGENGYFRLLRGVNACAMGTSYTATTTTVS